MIVLGIETSCDDTGIGIYDSEKGLLVNRLESQIDTHKPYGGVVPELASRAHQKNIMALIDAVLLEANITLNQIDLISYTAGPGLVGSLLVGAGVAQGLSKALSIPVIGVHHHLAHLEVAFLENQELSYPYLGILVSGGHTFFIHVDKDYRCKLKGGTIDDAIGEALDKSARVMGLGYPGGPIIEKLARDGNPCNVKLPRPMIKDPSLKMSFSGLKTAVIRSWEDHAPSTNDLSAALQEAIADVLVSKLHRALQYQEYENVVLSGGVAANQFLRQRLLDCSKHNNAKLYAPSINLCTDNGAMVAFLGYRLSKGGGGILPKFVDPSWSIEELVA